MLKKASNWYHAALNSPGENELFACAVRAVLAENQPRKVAKVANTSSHIDSFGRKSESSMWSWLIYLSPFKS